MPHQSLKAKINRISPVAESDWEVFASILRPIDFAKNDVMLQAEQINRGSD